MGDSDPSERTRHLAAESVAAGDPTGWFERVYAAAEVGEAVVPWARDVPRQALAEWMSSHQGQGQGRSALVVGCGLGTDAEYVAAQGFETVAFDIAPSAVRAAVRRFPDTTVRYVVADLLDPPAQWCNAFDLVVESLTVQALPRTIRKTATARVSGFVAPGGTLLVIAEVSHPGDDLQAGPPWPLTVAEVADFAGANLREVRIEKVVDNGTLEADRWRAEFHRP